MTAFRYSRYAGDLLKLFLRDLSLLHGVLHHRKVPSSGIVIHPYLLKPCAMHLLVHLDLLYAFYVYLISRELDICHHGKIVDL